MPGQLGEGVGLAPRHEDEGALDGVRVRQGQRRVGGGDALDLNEVDVEGAHAPRLGAHAAGGGLQGVADLEELARREGRHGHDHRVEVVGLRLGALGDDSDGAGQRRHLRDLDALRVLQSVDGRAQGLHDRADVGTQAEDDADGLGGALGERVGRHGGRGGRLLGYRSGSGGRDAGEPGLHRRRGLLRGVRGVGGLGEGDALLALLAPGSGVLTGRGEGAGLGQGLGG